MKTFRASIVTLAFLIAAMVTLAAQDLAGSWQGVMQAGGRELKMVVRISREADALKAVLYNIDQPGPGVGGTVTLQGSTVRITIPGLGGNYEGRLGSDGNAIEGAMTVGAQRNPLNLVRANADTAWTIPEPPAALQPMSADANPGIEVATIKPSPAGRQGKGFTIRGRQFLTINTSASDLITFAYSVHARQVSNGPEWLESIRYDVTILPDQEGIPNDKQLRELAGKLLAERFNFAFHHEQKELAVYALMVGKNGHKLTKSDLDPSGLPSLVFRGLGVLPARNASMANFAGVMQSAVLDRPVVDQTNLEGRYDFTLNWTPDETQFGGLGIRVPPPSDTAAAPGLFTAVQEQLGLRFESTRAPADVIVIDRLDKPTED
ncbi:MAG TPA: TIGR03435 family protein [Vicinamibacterales bacterium]|jgi:uncharacterized protein (TIGR03435 family)|nr:TIGR03435 family protein [Vicinamibacterales bacterium]